MQRLFKTAASFWHSLEGSAFIPIGRHIAGLTLSRWVASFCKRLDIELHSRPVVKARLARTPPFGHFPSFSFRLTGKLTTALPWI